MAAVYTAEKGKSVKSCPLFEYFQKSGFLGLCYRCCWLDIAHFMQAVSHTFESNEKFGPKLSENERKLQTFDTLGVIEKLLPHFQAYLM